jgi:hypothetical protein
MEFDELSRQMIDCAIKVNQERFCHALRVMKKTNALFNAG